MNYFNSFDYKRVLNVREGDKVEIILKSSLYCDENEEPQYHSGTVSEIIFEEFKEGNHPKGMYINFNKDDLYEDQEEELVLLSEIEDVFIKKYEILGYGQLNEGMTLSVKGEGISKIIWFSYRNGNLVPESISDGSNSEKRPITAEDKGFIREVSKYGAAQRFSHFVLSQSLKTKY